MHRGSFVWTPTPPSSGRSTPRPGRACVCVRVLPGRVGGPASWARFGAPHLSCGCFVLLLCSAPSGLGLPALRVFFCSFPLLPTSPLAPPLSPAFCASRPWVPWALALFVYSYPHPLFLPGFVLLSCVFCLLAAPCPPFWFLPRSPPPNPRPPSSFAVFLFVLFFPPLHPPRSLSCCCCRCPGPCRFLVSPHTPPATSPPPTFFLSLFSLYFSPSPRLSCLGFFVVSRPGGPRPRRFFSTHTTRRPSLSLSLFFRFAFPLSPGSGRSCCSWPLPRLAWSLFPPPSAALRAVCTPCARASPPPLPGGCSWFAVSRVLLCGASVRCGLSCVVRGVLRCFSVPCGVGVVLCAVLLCCDVRCLVVRGAVPRCCVVCCAVCCRWRSAVGAVSPFFVGLVRCLGEPCCFVRCFVMRGAVARCCLVCCAVCCPAGRCRLDVRPAALSGVFVSFPPPAPCCCPLSPLPGLLSLPVVLCCPGVRCRVGLLYRTSCCVLPQLGVAGRSRDPSPSTHIHITHPSQEWRGTSGARTQAHTYPNTPARSGGAQPKPEPKHTHTHRTPQPGVAGYQQSMQTSTHTPQNPGQEWRGAADAKPQAHTPTPHTPARSGRVPAGRAQKHTHTPKPQPGVAGRSQSQAPGTHTHTAHPSQELRGTSGVRIQAHTGPKTPARSGGAQAKPEPKHTQPHRTPQPGDARYKRSAHPFVGVVRCLGVRCCFVWCFVVRGAVARCFVVCCAMCCPCAWCCLVVRPAALCRVFVSSVPPPPCCCPLLPFPGPLWWPVDVCCPRVRCRVGLLYRPSCRVLPQPGVAGCSQEPEAKALRALGVVPDRGPAMGLSLAGLSGFCLSLRALWWFGVCGSGSLTCPVSRTVRISTGDLASAPGQFRVDAGTSPFGSEHATPGSRACVCACSSWQGRGGRPPGRFLVRLTFPVAVSSFFFVQPPLGWGCPRFGCFFFGHSPFFQTPLRRPRCLRRFVLPGPGCPGPWRSSSAPTPPPFLSRFCFVVLRFLPACGPLSPFFCFCPASPPNSQPPSPVQFCRFHFRFVFPFSAPSPRSVVLLLSLPRALSLFGLPTPPPRPLPPPLLSFLFFPLFSPLSAPLLSRLFRCFPPWGP